MSRSINVFSNLFSRFMVKAKSIFSVPLYIVAIVSLMTFGCQSAGGPGLTLGSSGGGSNGGSVYLDGGDGGSESGTSGATGDEGSIDLGGEDSGSGSGEGDIDDSEEVSGGGGDAMPPVSIPAPGPMINGALVAAAADASGNVPVFSTTNPWEASNYEGKTIVVALDELEEVVFYNQNKTQKFAKTFNKKLNNWTSKLFGTAHAVTSWGVGTERAFTPGLTRQATLKADWIPVVKLDEEFDPDFEEGEDISGWDGDEVVAENNLPEFCGAEENYGYIHCCEETVNADGSFSCVFPYGDIDVDLYENTNLHVYLMEGDEIVEGPYQEAPNRNLLWLNKAPQQIAGSATLSGRRIQALTQGAVAEIEVETDAELGVIHKVSGDHTKSYAVNGLSADNAVGLAVNSAGKVALLNRTVDGDNIDTSIDLYEDLRRQGEDDGDDVFAAGVNFEPWGKTLTRMKYSFINGSEELFFMYDSINNDVMGKVHYISNNIKSDIVFSSGIEGKLFSSIQAYDTDYYDDENLEMPLVVYSLDDESIHLQMSNQSIFDFEVGSIELSSDSQISYLQIYKYNRSINENGLALMYDSNSNKLGIISYNFHDLNNLLFSIRWLNFSGEVSISDVKLSQNKSKLYLVNSANNTIDVINLKNEALEWIDPAELAISSTIDLSDYFTKDLEITASTLEHHQLDDGKEFLMVGLSGVNSSLVIDLND